MQSNFNTTDHHYQRWLDEAGPYPDAEISPDDCCAFCGEPIPASCEHDICAQCDARARERDAAIREDLWHSHRKGER